MRKNYVTHSLFLYNEIINVLFVIFIFGFSLFLHFLSDKQRHRDILQGTGFVVTGGGILSYCNHKLIKFEEDKRFGL